MIHMDQFVTGELTAGPSCSISMEPLIDSVYQHVLAWGEALEHTGMELSVIGALIAGSV